MKNYQTGAVRQNTNLLTDRKFSKKLAMFGVMAAIASVSVFSSCKKEGNDASPSLKLNSERALSPTAGGTALTLSNVTTGTVKLSATGNIYSVVNYYVTQSVYDPANPHQANGLYYFDFSLNDNKKGATSTTAPSTSWDISFSGTGNADIKANTAEGVEVKFLNENFATATARTATSAWSAATTAAATFGHNRTITTSPLAAADYLAAASGHVVKGYWNYYFTNHQVIATTDVTILVKDGNGGIYALYIKSVYNNDTPTGTPYPSNFSYLTFDYKKL
nr:hypothetical protein [Pedobacter panaciterrae]